MLSSNVIIITVRNNQYFSYSGDFFF